MAAAARSGRFGEYNYRCACIAQLVEQLTLNQRDAADSSGRLRTRYQTDLNQPRDPHTPPSDTSMGYAPRSQLPGPAPVDVLVRCDGVRQSLCIDELVEAERQ
jgi:hypothetical protein